MNWVQSPRATTASSSFTLERSCIWNASGFVASALPNGTCLRITGKRLTAMSLSVGSERNRPILTAPPSSLRRLRQEISDRLDRRRDSRSQPRVSIVHLPRPEGRFGHLHVHHTQALHAQRRDRRPPGPLRSDSHRRAQGTGHFHQKHQNEHQSPLFVPKRQLAGRCARSHLSAVGQLERAHSVLRERPRPDTVPVGNTSPTVRTAIVNRAVGKPAKRSSPVRLPTGDRAHASPQWEGTSLDQMFVL